MRLTLLLSFPRPLRVANLIEFPKFYKSCRLGTESTGLSVSHNLGLHSRPLHESCRKADFQASRLTVSYRAYG